jgi:hypothetical protein
MKRHTHTQIVLLLILSLAAPLLLSADWQAPINMGPVVNSSQVEFSSSITMDGTHFYFARGPVENTDIYVSEYRNSQWQPPVNLGPNVNSSYADQDPTVIGDSMIIFSSNRPSPYSGYPFHLWFCKKDSLGNWTPAQLVGDPVDGDYGEATPWMMWEGRDTVLLFFCSYYRSGGQGDWDIWQARRISGVWQAPTNLGPPVNTSGLESSPNIWVSQTLLGLDSIRMYYVTNFGGYYADRIRGVWKNPVRLPDVINSGAMDRPTITFDNRTLYFTSDRPGGYGLRDIWYSTYTTGVESEGNRPVSSPEIGLTATPNPFQTRSLIAFSLSQEEGINLDIYGLDGRRIRSLVHSTFFPGTHRVIWDGCDDRGSSIGPGPYFLRLRTTKGSLTARLLKL